jgi:hypothetical protein
MRTKRSSMSVAANAAIAIPIPPRLKKPTNRGNMQPI